MGATLLFGRIGCRFRNERQLQRQVSARRLGAAFEANYLRQERQRGASVDRTPFGPLAREAAHDERSDSDLHLSRLLLPRVLKLKDSARRWNPVDKGLPNARWMPRKLITPRRPRKAAEAAFSLALPLEQARAEREQPLAPGSLAPFLQRDRASERQVGLEVALEERGEPSLEHREIHLVVEPERAVVEVGRPHHAPKPVDDEHLGVDHGRLVLVDLRAGGEQRPIAAPAREARDW